MLHFLCIQYVRKKTYWRWTFCFVIKKAVVSFLFFIFHKNWADLQPSLTIWHYKTTKHVNPNWSLQANFDLEISEINLILISLQERSANSWWITKLCASVWKKCSCFDWLLQQKPKKKISIKWRKEKLIGSRNIGRRRCSLTRKHSI